MKHAALLLLPAILLTGTIVAQAQPESKRPAEFTSRAAVAQDGVLNRDFQIQGEYVGEFDDDHCGVNIIAEGNGKFRFVAFDDGLPGDGWRKGEDRVFCDAVLNGNGDLIVSPKEKDDDGWREGVDADDRSPIVFKVENGRLHANRDNSLRKVERRSPTLDQRAPEGAVVLFADGTLNKEMWVKGEVNEEANPKTLWAEAETKPFEKKPYSLHLEFMLSYMPEARGQGRSNSGVFIDQAYECQVLDSFGLDGKFDECGGFYGVGGPRVNMCYPPLQWQTYDFDFVPARFDADGNKIAKARITLRHNGVLIHNGIEPDKETPGCKKEGPEARGLYLQGHGNKVQYRNIWIKYNN